MQWMLFLESQINQNFINYSQEKYHYNELSFIQLHQFTLQKKNNINKKQINEKHFKKIFLKPALKKLLLSACDQLIFGKIT